MDKLENKENFTLLLRFCKEHNLKYFLNDVFVINNCKGLKSNPKTLSIDKNFFDFLLRWNSTNEGFNYWYYIHLQWQIFLIKNGKLHSYQFDSSDRGHSEILINAREKLKEILTKK